MSLKPSPNAARHLEDAIANGMSPFGDEADDYMGDTDCPEGCGPVEPDGRCPHGYRSAALTLGVI